jgi:hypothetical protein
MIRDPSTDPALLVTSGSQLPWNGYVYMTSTSTYPEQFEIYVTDDERWVQYQSLLVACGFSTNSSDTKAPAINRGCIFDMKRASEWVVFRWILAHSGRNLKAEEKIRAGLPAGHDYLAIQHATLDNFFSGKVRGMTSMRWEIMKKWWASKPQFLRSVKEKDEYVAEFNRRHAEKYNLDLEKGVFKFD